MSVFQCRTPLLVLPDPFEQAPPAPGDELQPWQSAPHFNNVTRYGEWTSHCGPVVCLSLHFNQRATLKTAFVNGSGLQPFGVGSHEAWDSYCETRSRARPKSAGGRAYSRVRP